jgi:hypothetical protein
MLDYARQRAVDVLKLPRTAILATSGPAGVQASEVPCQGMGLAVYLLVPKTSDHLFNLESNPKVVLFSHPWEVKGEARLLLEWPPDAGLDSLRQSGMDPAEWYALVQVEPHQIHIHREAGWGNLETIDLASDY